MRKEITTNYKFTMLTRYHKLSKLHQLITECGLTISVEKTKSMAYKGRDPVRTKIVR